MKTEYKVIGVAVLFGIISWFINVSTDILFQKIFILVLFIVFGIILAKVIAKRKQTLKSLQRSHERFRMVADFTYDWEYWINPNGHFVYISPSCERITGYRVKDFFKDPDLLNKIIHPDDLPVFTRLTQEGQYSPIEFRIKTKDGKERWIGHVCQPVFSRKDGQYLGRRGNNRDVTERKIAEVQTISSLKQKEVLLREVYHRVKNNMQVISSILKLQARYIKDEEVLQMFKDSQNRVKSMSLIHEKLYQSNDLASINIADYIRSLVSLLLSSFKVDVNRIKININLKNIFLDIATAIPLGLIISEIVSNSLKYAFPDERTGEISFSIQKKQEDTYLLIISDNGVGIPPEIDFKTSESLGLHLINALISQLHGNVELNRTKGTLFAITFIEMKDKKRF